MRTAKTGGSSSLPASVPVGDGLRREPGCSQSEGSVHRLKASGRGSCSSDGQTANAWTVERAPAIFYLHPWEIDPEQPRLHAPALGRFRHYYNLGKTEERLRTLLRDFQFSSMIEVLEYDRPAPAVAPLGTPLPYLW